MAGSSGGKEQFLLLDTVLNPLRGYDPLLVTIARLVPELSDATLRRDEVT
jgi:hypothetical protein